MTNLDEIREQERKEAYQHLLAIRKIVAYKAKRDGADKAIGELFINGFFQFSFKDGLSTFECSVIPGPRRMHRIEEDEEYFEKNATVEVDLINTDINAENRDIVRHLIALRNIRNTRCSRCSGPNWGNCLGCGLSGREYFNVAAGLKLMMLYDWKAIYEVLGIKGYFDETNELVYKLEDCLGRNEQIKMAKPEYETNY